MGSRAVCTADPGSAGFSFVPTADSAQADEGEDRVNRWSGPALSQRHPTNGIHGGAQRSAVLAVTVENAAARP